MRVGALYVYPVKACRAIALEAARVSDGYSIAGGEILDVDHVGPEGADALALTRLVAAAADRDGERSRERAGGEQGVQQERRVACLGGDAGDARDAGVRAARAAPRSPRRVCYNSQAIH